MDKAIFYNAVRNAPFDGVLAKSQVEGMEAILDEWDKRNLTDVRWLAYILATTYHETARTMQPIEEYGKGAGKVYGNTPYYGRGFVQLTWDYNYRKMGDRLRVDLLKYPDKALDMDIATQILFEGMIHGMFTGVGLGKYFHEDSDWYNARKIVNGLDRAELIARYGRAFFFAVDIALKGEQTGKSMQDQLSDLIKEPVEGEIREIYREFGYGSLFM
ncbi:MAG: hypothetical protein QJT81_04000 [Candidatus Thiothrix putei]|uniref:Glycoside hydrolase family 19 catalytic domain-containing protein n=1 Tax=Candidatus Thiothrix putei TaxID=3080811 RepID=A0AA95HHY2_9GAMM|nr:MAG: hypothetical protein QJT81_04000 [Candidatus Thiothrix putei]